MIRDAPRSCYRFATLVLTYFRLTKGRITLFRFETTVISFLHLIVYICTVLLITTEEIFQGCVRKCTYLQCTQRGNHKNTRMITKKYTITSNLSLTLNINYYEQ